MMLIYSNTKDINIAKKFKKIGIHNNKADKNFIYKKSLGHKFDNFINYRKIYFNFYLYIILLLLKIW